MQEFYGTIRNVQSSPMKMNLVAKLVREMYPRAGIFKGFVFLDEWGGGSVRGF